MHSLGSVPWVPAALRGPPAPHQKDRAPWRIARWKQSRSKEVLYKRGLSVFSSLTFPSLRHLHLISAAVVAEKVVLQVPGRQGCLLGRDDRSPSMQTLKVPFCRTQLNVPVVEGDGREGSCIGEISKKVVITMPVKRVYSLQNPLKGS